jgi:hypothetical protein
MTLYFFHGDENTVVSFMDKSNSGIKVSGALLSDNDCTAWYHINGTVGNCHWREHICTDQWAYDVNLYVVLIYVFPIAVRLGPSVRGYADSRWCNLNNDRININFCLVLTSLTIYIFQHLRSI